MKLHNILQTIKTICYNQPNTNTVFVGDIYDLNTQKDIEYSVMVITEQTHTVNSNDGYEVWGINLFYVDRQTSDNSNILDIHSHAVEVLNSVVNELEEVGVIIENTYQINTFNERFAALCSGAYVTLNLRVPLATCDKYELVHSVNGMRGDVIIPISTPISQIEEGNTKDSVNSVAVIDYVEPIKNRVSSAETQIETIQSDITETIDPKLQELEYGINLHSGLITEANRLIGLLQNEKQNNLVSGENIKTVNGNSLLGSGDITIDGGSNFIGKLGSYTTYLSGFLNALSVKGAVSNFQGISKDAAQVGDIFIIEGKAADTHDYYIFVLECETPKTNDVRGHTIYSYIIRDYELLSNKVTQITSASTDTQYPSAKAVYTQINNNISTIITALGDYAKTNWVIQNYQPKGNYQATLNYYTEDTTNKDAFIDADHTVTVTTDTFLYNGLEVATEGDLETITDRVTTVEGNVTTLGNRVSSAETKEAQLQAELDKYKELLLLVNAKCVYTTFDDKKHAASANMAAVISTVKEAKIIHLTGNMDGITDAAHWFEGTDARVTPCEEIEQFDASQIEYFYATFNKAKVLLPQHLNCYNNKTFVGCFDGYKGTRLPSKIECGSLQVVNASNYTPMYNNGYRGDIDPWRYCFSNNNIFTNLPTFNGLRYSPSVGNGRFNQVTTIVPTTDEWKNFCEGLSTPISGYNNFSFNTTVWNRIKALSNYAEYKQVAVAKGWTFND